MDRRALVVLLAVIFMNIAGFGLVIPLLPFFGKAFGAEPWEITLLFSAFSLGQFLGEPFWGRLSDRIGRRPVLLITIVAGALAYVALAFSPNIVVAWVVRFLGGVFSGNISTLQGCMADISKPEERAGRMGIMGSAFSLGFMVGPALGGFLAQPQLGPVGFQLPLFAAAAFGAASALGVLLFVRESAPARGEGPVRSQRAALGAAFANPVIARIIMIGFVVTSGFAGIEATYGLWTEHRFAWGPRQIGSAFFVIGMLGAFMQGVVSGRMARRFGEANVLTGGLALMLLGLLTQYGSPNWPVAMLGFVFVCIGQSLCFPNLSGLISRSTPPDRQGEMMGVQMSVSALGRIGGPIFAGQLFSMVSPGSPFLLTAALIIPALVFAFQIRRRVGRAA
jgi:MFS family permease